MKNYIFEIESTPNTEEHLDVVGGPSTDKLDTCIKLIKSEWESPDDFWVVEIKSRSKDITKNGLEYVPLGGFLGIGGNRVGYSIIHGQTVEDAINSLKNIKITLFDWAQELRGGNNIVASTDGNMNALYLICDEFYARAYFSINKRNFSKTKENIKKKGNNDDYDFLNFATYGKGNNLVTFIDCDIDPDSVSKLDRRKRGTAKIKKLINLLKSNGITILKSELSHNGVHIYIPTREYEANKKTIKPILDKDFNATIKIGKNNSYEFSNNRHGDEPIKFKNNSYLMIYSPCGKKPDQTPLLNKNLHRYDKVHRLGTSSSSANPYRPKDKSHNQPGSYHDNMYNRLKQNFSLNESNIAQMVSECVKKLLSESDINMRDRIGSKGPLTVKDLLSPNEIFKTTLQLIDEYKHSDNKTSFDEFFGNDPGYLIWKNYVKSMTGVDETEPMTTKTGSVRKNANGEPIMVPKLKNVKRVKVRDENGNVVLGPDGKPQFEDYPKIAIGFIFWVENMTSSKKIDEFGGIASKIYAYKYNDSYLFGYYNLGIFIANSFSGGNSGINQLVSSICEYNNIVFSVSMDLAPMLVKLGLYTDGKVHTVQFGGQNIKKMTLTTNPDLIGINDEFGGKNGAENNNTDKNFLKSEKLKNFFSKNPQLLWAILADEGVQEYLNAHPEDSEMFFTKIMNDFLSKKNGYKSKRKKQQKGTNNKK
jgi:hypothetical protein